MLKWHKYLLTGPGVRNRSKIRHKLDHGRIVPGIFLITLSENPSNLLEILPALTLIQESAALMCPEIIGIAKGKEEDMDMVTEIIQEIYSKTGGFNIKEYWKNR